MLVVSPQPLNRLPGSWLAVVLIVAVRVTVSITVIIVVVAEVTIMTAVPVVIVVDAASLSRPVAGEEALPIMAGCDPICPGIRRARPIAFMPSVVISHRIPIALDPNEFRIRRRRRFDVYSTRRWRRADQDPDRHLRFGGRYRAEKGSGKQRGFDEIFHRDLL